MAALVWVSGSSSGIGRALIETVPFEPATVIGLSRRPSPGCRHLSVDLADPSEWARVEAHMAEELAAFTGERVVFVHAAATIEPIGFAGAVDSDRYRDGVLLNTAAPLALGAGFLRSVAGRTERRQLVLLSSGAARRVYPGLSIYGPGKAAIDQWVRTVGAEQLRGDGVQVLAVTPGRVASPMQDAMRAASDAQFPDRAEFVALHRSGALSDPAEVAVRMWEVLDADVPTGSVLDLRDWPR